MAKTLLLALALCAIPAPAYAHGLYLPEGLVNGVFGVLAISLGAACSLPGNFLYRFLYFIAGIAGGAACAIGLLSLIGLAGGENGRREALWLIGMTVPAACIIASWLTSVLASNMILGNNWRQRSSKMFLALWIVLALVSVIGPYCLRLFGSGYGQTFFMSTVLPFVSAIVIVIAAIAGLIIKVDIKTDYAFRRFFLYWPFATLFVMLICDTTSNFPGKEIVQIVVWYALLLGLPIGAVVFIRRRLKQKGQAPPANT
ncbi:MAG: hypothetical protein ACAH80_17505 [Alphaproteobacteria bacterium]